MNLTVDDIKRFFIAFALILVSCTGSRTIYVSQIKGSDNGTGMKSDPVNTISAALNIAGPGSTIKVMNGIYREKLTIKTPGLKIEAAGDKVFVTGTDEVKNFEKISDGYFKAYFPKKVTRLFIDGVPQVRAKYPNQNVDPDLFKFTTINVKVSGDTLVSDEIPAVDGFFDGASVWMILWKRWVGGTAKVKKHKGHMLILEKISCPYRGEGIAFISDVKNCFDNDGEWYWNNDTLYYINGSIDISKSHIEAKTRETLIELDGVKDVKIAGMNGYAGNVIFRNTEGCKISNGKFKWLNDYDFIDAKTSYSRGKKATCSMYGTGIAMFGTKDTLSCCEVSWAAGDCVSLYGSENVVVDCIIHDANYRGTDAAPVALGGIGNRLLYSEVYNGGRDVLSAPSAQAFKVLHNEIHHSGLVAWDVGLLYTYNTDGKDAEIAYNIVHDAWSGNPDETWGASGIYLDNNSRNFLVHHNVSFNVKGLGIQVNDPGRNIRVYNNTVFNTTHDMAPWNNGQFPGIEGANCKFYNNYFDRPVKKTEWIEEKANVYSAEDFLQDRNAGNYMPKKGSELIDAGVVVGELKDIPYAGKAPDVGAFEYGMPAWKAGPGCNSNNRRIEK